MKNDKYNCFLIDLNTFRSNVWKLHWNVTGPIFIQQHRWYDEIYHEVVEFVDRLAELVKGLGKAPLSNDKNCTRKVEAIESKDYDAETTIAILKRDLETLKKDAIELAELAHNNKDVSVELFFQDFVKFADNKLYFIYQLLK